MIAEEEIEEEKVCEQCKLPKRLSAFHRRRNKTDGRMRICAECYTANLQKTLQYQKERFQSWERRDAEEKKRKLEENQHIRVALPELMRSLFSGSTKPCEDCKQEFQLDDHGHLVAPRFPPETCEQCGSPILLHEYSEGRVSYGCPGHIAGSGPIYEGWSDKYCPTCHEARRMKNRQAYPLCPMCNAPTRVYDFMREYQGFWLDIIRVCCERCTPRFEALSESEQLEYLRRAIVKAYGETAVIYALQYDDQASCHHIGRTKHYMRRMAEYKRNWHRDIHHDFVLQQRLCGFWG